jgi:hypothetical protein
MGQGKYRRMPLRGKVLKGEIKRRKWERKGRKRKNKRKGKVKREQ